MRFSPRDPHNDEGLSRIVAELSSAALTGNYNAIRAQVPELDVLPMVKADAYGHGATWVAKMLQRMPALYGFGVATLEEGRALRRELGASGRRTRILVFSGASPWREETGQFCERHGLTPVIATEDDWHAFFKGRWPERVSYELKFNTGMNRLGIPVSLGTHILKQLRSKPALWQPHAILTHLAAGEQAESRLSQQQVERFIGLRKQFSEAFPRARFHFANSAGIWNQKYFRVRELSDVVRPGISLYGVPPWQDAPLRNIVPVLTLRARVLAIHSLRAGESVGYGGTYAVPSKKVDERARERVATLAAGYADGVHRALSDRGQTWIGGQYGILRGIVSMDLCSSSCSAGVRVGDWAELIAPQIDIWRQARLAGTIPYELLTSISNRVERVHV